MAAVDGGTVPVVGPTTTTSSTFQTVATINAAAFKVDNAKYLIVAIGKVSGTDSGTPNQEYRMAQGATPTEIAGSFLGIEVQSTSASVASQYNWFTIFTQPATAVDVVFQHRSVDNTLTTRTDDLHLFWMRLDTLTEDTDWKVATDLASPTDAHDGTMTSRLSLTWTPATASHDWLIFGVGTTEIDTAGDYNENELFDSTGSAILGFHKREGEDTAEIMLTTIIGVLENLPATEQIVQWRTRDTTGTGQTNNYVECELFCIDLDVFEDHVVDVKTTLDQDDNNFKEANALSVTPTTAGDWVVVGSVQALAGTAGSRTKHRIELEDVTTIPTGFADDPRYTVVFDAADAHTSIVAAFPNFAASAQNIDIDVMWQNNSGQSWNYRTGAAWSLELAAVAAAVYPPFPRRQNTLVRM